MPSKLDRDSWRTLSACRVGTPADACVKVTRRQLAATLAGGSLLAQAPTPPFPTNPEEELKAARDEAKQRGDQLAKISIFMSTEPAFQFKP